MAESRSGDPIDRFKCPCWGQRTIPEQRGLESRNATVSTPNLDRRGPQTSGASRSYSGLVEAIPVPNLARSRLVGASRG